MRIPMICQYDKLPKLKKQLSGRILMASSRKAATNTVLNLFFFSSVMLHQILLQ